MTRALARMRLPIGAEPVAEGGVQFRVWAPRRRRVEVVLEHRDGAPRHAVPLEREEQGYFSGHVPEAEAGALYRYRLDGGERFPDPASRFQPQGPHGPSQVVDPSTFAWSDAAWPGVRVTGQVVYELHIGTFTREGTWAAAARELPALAELGITVLEVMPIADFPGRFGWGYDGVDLFAPTRLYGRPDDLRAFVDRAHALGLGVILDVVYNHFGPDGNYLTQFADAYFSEVATEWGNAINFDGPNAGPVRAFFVANAGYWIAEYHLDGLRLDATQSIHDDSPRHVLAEVTESVRRAARGRGTLVVAENERQEVRLLRPAAEGGCGIDALWNDDFHHSAVVALTGRREAYYSDHLGKPQEFVSALKHGFLYQGQLYAWQGQRRGTPALDLPPWRFVQFLENHDQVANSPLGLRPRALANAGLHRAFTALVLLAPQTPMLFQGQEFAASAGFHYFADHARDLAGKVRAGRREFLRQFPSLATKEMEERLRDPSDLGTFADCKLDHSERERHARAWALHRDLLAIRRGDPVIGAEQVRLDGAVLGHDAFAMRWLTREGDDRLLLVNLGCDLHLVHAPEPLLAPPGRAGWALLWSSEDPRYGGHGTPRVENPDGWRIPGNSAVLLKPAQDEAE